MAATVAIYSGLEKSAVWSSGTSRFSCWASNVSFSLAQLARDQSSRLLTRSFKEQMLPAEGGKTLFARLRLRYTSNMVDK